MKYLFVRQLKKTIGILRFMDENRSSQLLAEERNEKFWASLKGKKSFLIPDISGEIFRDGR